MKKFLISIGIIGIILFFYKDRIIIPKDSIRIRILANSNSEYDQHIKEEVKDILENDLSSLLINSKRINEAREKIINHIDELDYKIDTFLKENKYNQNYSIDYGYHYFPRKEYKGVTYDEGMYESLLVTLGNGNGDNWWCVMFPPFCLIEASGSEKETIEYRWYVKDLINKYFKN